MEYEWENNEEITKSDGDEQETVMEETVQTDAEAGKETASDNKVFSDESYEEQTEPVVEKPKKKKGGRKILVILLCVILGGAAAGSAFFGLLKLTSSPESTHTVKQNNERKDETEPVQISGTERPDNLGIDMQTGTSYDLSALVEKTMPSLVSITNQSVQEVENFFSFFGYGNAPSTQEVTSLGSGVIVRQTDDELLIVTNAHVVDGANTLTVSFYDNESYEAYIKGSDSDVDIALIGVKLSDLKESTLDSIAFADFGDSDSIKVGQQVMAIGNALGYGQSVTTGIISALHRTNNTTTSELIQTDAAINSGNSGGALFNMQGEIIGINNSKPASATVDGMGYAIPAASVIPLVEEYSTKTAREKVSEEEAAYLGIVGQDVDSSIEKAYGIPQGIYIQNILKDSPVDAAGVLQGYVMVKFDGTTVTSMDKLKSLITYYSAGEKVDIVFMVNENGSYTEKQVTVTLGKASDYSNVKDSDYKYDFNR